MSLWGNKYLVYDDGTVAVNFTTKKVVGTGATFNTAGIHTGNVITVGAGATFGYATISAIDSTSIEKAQKMIEDIVAEPEKGVIYKGKVVKTVDFGAFVNFLGAKDGLVHISELQNERTEKTTDVCKENDEVYVKVIGFDDRGKVKLSMKRVDQETGNDLEKD